MTLRGHFLKIILVVEGYGTRSRRFSPICHRYNKRHDHGRMACALPSGSRRGSTRQHCNQVAREMQTPKEGHQGLPTGAGRTTCDCSRRSISLAQWSNIEKKNMIADLDSLVSNSAFIFHILMLLYQSCNKSTG